MKVVLKCQCDFSFKIDIITSMHTLHFTVYCNWNVPKIIIPDFLLKEICYIIWSINCGIRTLYQHNLFRKWTIMSEVCISHSWQNSYWLLNLLYWQTSYIQYSIQFVLTIRLILSSLPPIRFVHASHCLESSASSRWVKCLINY